MLRIWSLNTSPCAIFFIYVIIKKLIWSMLMTLSLLIMFMCKDLWEHSLTAQIFGPLNSIICYFWTSDSFLILAASSVSLHIKSVILCWADSFLMLYVFICSWNKLPEAINFCTFLYCIALYCSLKSMLDPLGYRYLTLSHLDLSVFAIRYL